MLLDCHSHRPAPYLSGIISLSPGESLPDAPQLFSAGIHPWDIESASQSSLEELRCMLASPQAVALGEAGLDTLRGGQMYKQMQYFFRQAEMAKELCMPMILHDVKSHESIIGVRKDTESENVWVIHGFRGKPSVAKMLIDAGCMLSFGLRFNAETVQYLPSSAILAETDDSGADIRDVIAEISKSRGEDMTARIEANMRRVFIEPLALRRME